MWYQNAYSGQLLAQLNSTTLSDVIRRNTTVSNLQSNAFFMRAEINGQVKYGEVTRGSRKITITGDDGGEREYALPRGVHINVQEGERVRHGDPLMDGPRNPHDIMAVLGEKALQNYLVNEIQEVYRLQGVNINDKHL
jgi:DNA-directed RNA polymerase subunit beta'